MRVILPMSIQKLKDGPHKRDMIRAYVKKVRRQYGKKKCA